PYSPLTSPANDPNPSGEPARLTVPDSFLDGTIACLTSTSPPCGTETSPIYPEVYGIIIAGDVDAVLERNVIRRSGAACILVLVRDDLAGETNVDIVDNDLDEYHSRGGAGAIGWGPRGENAPPAPRPLTAPGEVNTVGTTTRNSPGSCRTPTAINFQALGGQVERKRIEGVVQACSAVGGARAFPAG